MALAYNPDFSGIFFNREMGAQEKVGHWMSRCELKPPEVEEWVKLNALTEWATGCRLHPEASVTWDPKNRIMKVHFTPSGYYREGNRWFKNVVEAMKTSKRGLPLSGDRLPFWLFHFPHKVEEGSKPVEEQKEAVEKPFVPKVTRNARRKPKAAPAVEVEDLNWGDDE